MQFQNTTTASNRGEAADVYMFEDDQANQGHDQNPGLSSHRVSNPSPRRQVSENPKVRTSRRVSNRNRSPENSELTDNPESGKSRNHHSGNHTLIGETVDEPANNVMSEKDFEMNLEAFSNDLV